MTTAPTPTPSRATLWTGRVLSTLAALFLIMDGVMKIVRPAPVLEATLELGFPAETILPTGIILLACVVVHLVPRTSLLGAILLTGYLGGAVATHLRLIHPLATHTFFPIYVGILVWGGLFLRDERLRALFPFRR